MSRPTLRNRIAMSTCSQLCGRGSRSVRAAWTRAPACAGRAVRMAALLPVFLEGGTGRGGCFRGGGHRCEEHRTSSLFPILFLNLLFPAAPKEPPYFLCGERASPCHQMAGDPEASSSFRTHGSIVFQKEYEDMVMSWFLVFR